LQKEGAENTLATFVARLVSNVWLKEAAAFHSDGTIAVGLRELINPAGVRQMG